VQLKPAARGKYGLVTVSAADGAVLRQYRITGEELAALQQSDKGIPPGCTAEEWESGRVVVFGKDHDVGDADVVGGRLRIKTGERIVAGEAVESWLVLERGEWSGEDIERASVPESVLTSTDQRRAGVAVQSLKDGRLEIG
jgi:hypothetical protein